MDRWTDGRAAGWIDDRSMIAQKTIHYIERMRRPDIADSIRFIWIATTLCT